MFGVKDPIPIELRPCADGIQVFVVCCKACYVSETSRHFSTPVREHLATDRTSHVYKHLQYSKQCHSLCSPIVLIF